MSYLDNDITAENAEPQSDYASLTSALSCGIAQDGLTCVVGEHSPINNSYMRMLAGIEPPKLGRVTLYGNDSNNLDERQRRELRLKIGFVDVDTHLLSVLNGYDNLKLPAQYHGIGNHDEIEERADRLIADIVYDADHNVIPAYMTRLQKRHLIIARALMLEPSVLFIDNPLEGLDHFARRLVIDYLTKTIKEKGITVVTGNTDMIFTGKYADQIIFIGMGQTLTFDDWDGLVDSSNKDVIRFLGLEKFKDPYQT